MLTFLSAREQNNIFCAKQRFLVHCQKQISERKKLLNANWF